MSAAPGATALAPRRAREPRLFLRSVFWTARTARYLTGVVPTIGFFRTVRRNPLARHPVTEFRYGRLRFAIRPVDWYAMNSILLEREYGVLDLLFAQAPPRTVIDAGAHVGLFAVYLLSSWPEAQVLSVEASPDTFALLEKNREGNPGYAWRADQCALWDRDGEVSFDSGGLSMGWHVSTVETRERVPAARLDTYLANRLPGGERVSLLKIDIEGAEERALSACPEVLDRVDAVLVEIHPPSCDEEAVLRLLRGRFPRLYELGVPHQSFPVVVAARRPLAGAPLRPLP
jgi:FkbM family methyltransferase